MKVGEDGDASNYISNTEWSLVKLHAERNVRFYSCCAEPYPQAALLRLQHDTSVLHHHNGRTARVLHTERIGREGLDGHHNTPLNDRVLDVGRRKYAAHFRRSASRRYVGYGQEGEVSFLPIDEAIASRVAFVIDSGSDGRTETRWNHLNNSKTVRDRSYVLVGR